MNYVNGQVWIDSKSPNRLKYKVNNEVYSVDVSSEVQIGNTPLYPGNVVAFESKDVNGKRTSSVHLATFPQDLENVVGVVGSAVAENSYTSILKSGVISLDGDAINKVMLRADDGIVVGKENDTPGYWIGAPVYWFIGKVEKDNQDNYVYTDSSMHPGCLTISTPSGVKWKETVSSDDSLNVGYDNLPIVGNIMSYEVGSRYSIYDVPESEFDSTINGEYFIRNDNQEYQSVQNGTFTKGTTYYTSTIGFSSLKIYLNINKFDSSLEWNWPYLCKSKDGSKHECGKLTPTSNDADGKMTAELTIRHGLFPNNDGDSNSHGPLVARNFCDIIAVDNEDNEYVVNAGIENFYGTDDETDSDDKSRRTEIYLSTPDTYRYRISGRVNYKFDKKKGETV